MKHLGILIAASSAIALTGGTLQAKTLTMALDRAGTLFNATGSGIAKVASKHSGHRMIVRAFGGPDSYMSQLNDGKYDFSAISSPTAYFNFNGRTKNKKSTKNIRLIQAGSGALRLSFVVYADSDIKTFADLKGKRVTSDFGGHTVINPMVTYALKSAGLGWKDVRGVPVTGALDAPRALGAGRVDATWASLGMPVVREIHAKKKVRYLSFDKSPATLAMLRKNIFPGVRLVTVPPIKPLQRLGIAGKTTLLTFDSYIVTHTKQDPKVIKDVLQALWDNTPELNKAHFSLRGFKHKSAASNLPLVPYHPAAIAFYKEKGIWTDAVAKANSMVK